MIYSFWRNVLHYRRRYSVQNRQIRLDLIRSTKKFLIFSFLKNARQ